MQEQNTDKSSELFKYFKFVTYACVISMAVVCIMFTAAHFVILKCNLPLKVAEPIIIITSVISAFVGGFSAAKQAGKNGLLLGFLTGVMIFVLLLISNLSYGNKLGALAAIKFLLITTASSIGGIVGVNKGKRKTQGKAKKYKRKRKIS